MKQETIFKHTVDYEESLIEDLKNPEEAQAYLEAAIDASKESGDTESLLLALRDVAKAQGGISQLSKRTGMNRVYLTKALSNKNKPGLNNLISILSGLGFKIRLEPLSPPQLKRVMDSP